MIYQNYFCNCDCSKPCESPPGIAMCEVGVGGQETVLICPRCGKSVYCEPMTRRISTYFCDFDRFYAQYPECRKKEPATDAGDLPAVPFLVEETGPTAP